MAAALDMPCSFCYYANMACKPISAFHAIYHFAFLYRILDFTHNLKKNHLNRRPLFESEIFGTLLLIIAFLWNNDIEHTLPNPVSKIFYEIQD